MLALEDVLYSPDLDVPREKALHQLCVRVQAALDQSEAIVKVYGTMNGMAKLAAKVFSPAPAKFEAATGELAALAKLGQLLLRQPGSTAPLSGSANSTTVLAAEEAPDDTQTRDSSSDGRQRQQEVLAKAGGGSEGQDSGGLGLQSPSLRSMAAAGTSESSSGRRSFNIRNQETPVEALQPSKVFRGGHGQLVSALLYVPPRKDQAGSMGCLWFYISRRFAGGSLFVQDLSSSVRQEVKEARGTSVVTCMHLDDARGWVWTGHSNGNVCVWEEASRTPLCNASRAFHRQILVSLYWRWPHVCGGRDLRRVQSLFS